MTANSDLPLGPPPRKAHVRRGARNLRRAYGTLFALVILVFGGWALLDALRWAELSSDQRFLTCGFAVVSLIAVVIVQFVDHPLRRELRLARRGEVAQGQIVSIGKSRGRRPSPRFTYTYRTTTGAIVEGACTLPRRFPIETLAPGMTIDVLYDPQKPQINKPRMALEYVDFGETPKKKNA
jgi:hypothetical protein